MLSIVAFSTFGAQKQGNRTNPNKVLWSQNTFDHGLGDGVAARPGAVGECSLPSLLATFSIFRPPILLDQESTPVLLR
jgi:hypothetical protein